MNIIKQFLKKLKFKNLLTIVVVLGIIIRIIYVYNTPFDKWAFNHDQYGENHGHIDYIMYIYKYMSLPNDNYYTFSHPPLFHFISALWMKCLSLFNDEKEFLLNSLHTMALIISILTLITWKKIVDELNLQFIIKLFLLAMVALNSWFIVLAGMTNNDPLAILLSLLAVLYLIKWYKITTYKDILIAAICTGLAVMTKISSGILAIPFSIIFINKLLTGKSELKKIICQIVCFAVISLSLGLWFPIRNRILFNQPLVYVFDIQLERLYVGDNSVYERFFPLSEDFFIQYANPGWAKNIPIYLLKTSLFGEFTYSLKFVFLYMIAIVFHLIATIIEIYLNLKIYLSNENKILIYALLSLWLVNILSYLVMNIKYPYGCSMDFRYIVFAWFAHVLLMGYSANSDYKNKKQTFIYACFLEIISYFSANLLILSI